MKMIRDLILLAIAMVALWSFFVEAPPWEWWGR